MEPEWNQFETDDISHEIRRIRADINSLGNKIRAADYGHSSDTKLVTKQMKDLNEQINMLLHQVAPIEEIHLKSLAVESRLERVERRLKKQDEIKQLMSVEQLRHTWLPIYAVIQLVLSWAIFFK
ncbi:hypothetical protein [uncultured Cohaesibacter sp.]|uniref:hypothetical protein n=1 Tax=uncultured Cohaesibacter sp. TaxID=1002546 RepID=UPI002931A476|nr:hypothetical protein [uncultured Cohaesibacter sp.]